MNTKLVPTIVRAVSLATLVMLATSCFDPPAPEIPPPPPAAQAPSAMTDIPIYVHRYQREQGNADDEYDYHHMPGFTTELREAFALALTNAGYTVVLDRRTPADVTALLYEQWPMPRDGDSPRSDGVATLTLRSSSGEVIDRFSAPVPALGTGYRSVLWQSHAAAALVTAVGRSSKMRAFVDRWARSHALQVAGDDG